MKTEHKVIAGSMIFALLVWVSEAVLDYFYFYEMPFVELLISNMPPHETYIRLLVLACFLVFGILMSRVIAERKRAEEALREERDRAQKYLDISGVIVIVIDADQTVTLVNRKGCEILGYEEKEIVGKNWFDSFVPEKDRDRVKAIFEKLVAGEIEPVKYFENPVLTQSGKERMIAWHNTVLRDREGQVIATLSSGDDITEHKRIEEALRRYADEQAALYAVTSAVATSLDPGEMLSTVLEVVLSVLDSDAGWVTMPGPTLDDPPRVVAWRGVPESLVAAEMATPIRNCPVCAPLLASGDAQTEPQLVIGCPRLPPEMLTSVNLYSHVCIPLSAGCQVLGILDVAWRAPRPCTKSDRALLLAIGRGVGLALRNAQLYQAARQVDRLRVLNELDQALAATLDPETVAGVTLYQIAAALDAPMGALFALPSQANAYPKQAFTLERGWLDVVASEEEAQQLQAFLQQFQDSQEAVSLSGDDLAAISGQLDLARRWGPNGLVVPIRSDGRLAAVLALGGRPADRPFTDEDRALAQAAAGRAGQAIENARLFEQAQQEIAERKWAEEALQQQLEELVILHAVATAGAEATNENELIECAIRVVDRVFVADRFSVLLLDEAAGLLRLHPALRPSHETKDMTIPLGRGLAGRVMADGQPCRIPDVTCEPEYPESDPLTRSQLCVPLKAGRRVIGVINAENTRPDAFSEADERLLTTFAGQLAIAMEKVRLMKTLQRRVDDRTRELSALYDVTAMANEPMGLKVTLEHVLERVLVAMRSNAGAIHLLDEAGETLRLTAQQGVPPDVVARIEVIPVGSGLVGWVAEHGQSLAVPDIGTDPRAFQIVPMGDRWAYVGVPVQVGEQPLGVVSVLGETEERFSLEEMALLASIADHVGVVVENAWLRQQAERAAVMGERERLARELHDSVTQSLYGVTLLAETGRRSAEDRDLESVAHYLSRLGETAQQALKEMRLLVYELRPSVLQREGLVGALQQRLDAVEKRVGVEVCLLVEGTIELPVCMEEGLYRIAQEALNNALKHAAATSVKVYIRASGERVELEVVDDGKGFNPDAVTGRGGMGLGNMRGRAERLGGVLTLLSAPGEGTRVQVSIEAHPEMSQ